jgi:DNA-binding MarR family transcriptional regulator
MPRASRQTYKNVQAGLKGLPPEEAVPYLLKSLHHSLRQVVDEALRLGRIDMSFAHLATLFAVDSEPGSTGGELARRVCVTAQTMNTILRRLEADSQIERGPHPSNPRADSWHVTRSGRGRLARAKVVGTGIWRNMLASLTPAEVRQLQGLLLRCISSFDQQSNAAPPSPPRSSRTVARRGSPSPRKRA